MEIKCGRDDILLILMLIRHVNGNFENRYLEMNFDAFLYDSNDNLFDRAF